jgi:hypothetical protein
MVLTSSSSALSVPYESLLDQLTKSGDIASLRFPFAFFLVNE